MKYAIPILVLLMGADLVSTHWGLSAGAIEANPLFPMEWMVVAKLGAIAFIVSGCYYLRDWKPAKWWPRIANLFMAAVVVNNIIVLAIMQGGMKI